MEVAKLLDEYLDPVYLSQQFACQRMHKPPSGFPWFTRSMHLAGGAGSLGAPELCVLPIPKLSSIDAAVW